MFGHEWLCSHLASRTCFIACWETFFKNKERSQRSDTTGCFHEFRVGVANGTELRFTVASHGFDTMPGAGPRG